jgi:hypothetical protein
LIHVLFNPPVFQNLIIFVILRPLRGLFSVETMSVKCSADREGSSCKPTTQSTSTT